MTYNTAMGFLRLVVPALAGAVFLSCEKLVLDPNGATPKPADSVTASAKITVSNEFTHYPGTYSILIYPVTAMTVQDPYAFKLGDVAQNGVVQFNLQSGRWHVGVSMPDGTAFPLVISPGSTDWVIINPEAGKSYYLDFFTNAGGNNVWSTNIPRE